MRSRRPTDQNLPIFNSNTNTAQKAEPKLTPNAEKIPLPNEKTAKEKTVKEKEKKPPEVEFGVEALDDFVLRVTLKESDKDFPKLVAHPMFRPIYGDGVEFETGKLNAAIVTNGAFRISSVGQNSITLDRADNFWAKNSVEIERVSFIANQSAEKALESYRNGEVDAVTNANFEPLALKLLAPYEDFKRETHSALNFYEINRNKKPFDDVRVREALAISIERERLTEIETDGAARPALSFLPFDEENTKKIVQDKSRAKELLTEAGFDDGEDFPVIKLVVNRNDVQQRIAKAVVKMWKQTLNIDTVIVVKEASEIETVRQNGDFDILRRGVVLPTADETAGLTAIFQTFQTKEFPKIETLTTSQKILKQAELPAANSNSAPKNDSEKPSSNTQVQEDSAEIIENNPIPNEDEAIEKIHSIPLYFPTSYSLVKPYIQGFEINTLDAPSLKDVKIDNNWQPKKPKGES